MIKIITLITKFIVVAITALLFASCNQIINNRSIKGSGHVTIEKRNIQGDFKSIEVSNAIELVLEQSDKTEITVEADDNLQNEITTRIENGKLIIECDYNSFLNISSKKVTVKMPVIEQLETSSSATIRSTNTLKGEHISLKTSSSGNIDVTLEADAVNCDSSSGSVIMVKGMALQLKTSSSSGSSIEAASLLANDVDAQASSGSTQIVHPIISLKADASSGSSINYNVVPKSLQKNANSGASINQQ
jgi:Putative auto-transporter adhesin, head GIN domain